MKYLFFILSISFSMSLWANNYEYLQGLRYKPEYRMGKDDMKEAVYFEISGYDIVINPYRGDFSERKTLDKIKQKFKLNDFIQAEYTENKLDRKNLVIETERPIKHNLKVKLNEVYYLIPISDDKILIFCFSTLGQRDFVFEQGFVRDYLDEKLEPYISDDWSGEYIDFAGRNIQLGNACGWKSPHNFYCKGAQISWSEFPSFERAEIHQENFIAAGKRDNVLILSEDFIAVEFEGVPTIAHRLAVLEEKSYNRYPLIVYYICEEIRGHYISCTMSHYGINRADYELPDLLREFMSFSQEPYGAFNKYDYPQLEGYTPEEKEYFNSRIPIREIRLGSFIALGNLQKTFVWAPSFDIFLGLPIRKDMAIDIGFSAAPSINRRPINIYDGEIFQTEVEAVIGLGIRYRYQKQLSNNIFAAAYGGIGASFLSTDLEKENSKKDNTEYYQVIALDLYGGASIRYKKVGFFFEYHHPFFEKSRFVRHNFGNQMLQTGLFVAF
jgi:hypothetical protein